ncbi:carbon catabolite repressor protein 4 homolog 6-like isoform X4 [Dioscorea cayenensis subsp. rotundata]|uniref:Carbon catabolite repressor protein 4 homolog 6-like isoform X4 n=1 Tax=Dioscorea cayennensis subsp. rotundata TaxID=55577 RepID=A0AB40AQG6_DIOCR|nr:carbon catabolite repressor protein 4 homolog 6-like isoform X4 [Dioscorea cayenensis subsp. rotundata]
MIVGCLGIGGSSFPNTLKLQRQRSANPWKLTGRRARSSDRCCASPLPVLNYIDNKVMPLGSHHLQCLSAAMSFSRANTRSRNPWCRGFCDPPPSDGGGGRFGSFVSGDSHIRTVSDANFVYRHGCSGKAWVPRGPPYQSFQSWPPPPNFVPFPPPPFSQPPPYYRPFPPPFRRPTPQPKPADHRYWVFSQSQPPPQCERFTVMSYNILADYLARDHRSKLYFHIPHRILDWEWRKRRILLEFGLWAADIICLQEVDHFHDLEEELARRGYTGIWKMRTGMAVDGCAVFWQTNRFQLRHEENIEYCKLGLRDNVAQILVLESKSQNLMGSSANSLPGSSNHLGGTNLVVICNIHVLYNPKRGEIKIGQVRMLLDKAYAVSRHWNNAPVVICGDFNCTPKSSLYNYILEQKLSLSGLARNQVSGQLSANLLYTPRSYSAPNMYSAQAPANCSSTLTSSGGRGSNYPNTDHQNNSDNCLRDTSSRAEPIQASTQLVDMSGGPSSDNQCINDISKVFDAKALHGLGDPQGENIRSSNQPSKTPTIVETNVQQPHVQTVSGRNGPFSGELHQNGSVTDPVRSIRNMPNVHFPPAKSAIYDKLIEDSLDSKSSCKDAVLSQGLSDSSLDVLDGNLILGLSLKQVGELKIQDATPDGGKGTAGLLGETSAFITACATSKDNNSHQKSIQPIDKDENQASEESVHEGVFSRSKSEKHIGVCHGDSVMVDLCMSEESSDPNFIKELLGNEDEPAFSDNIYSEQSHSSPIVDECERMGVLGVSRQIVESNELHKSESDASHMENQKDTTPMTVPPYCDLSYDPFLWTPMEIETASGNAERDFVEHNLRLRSAYRDVKDYAGTKDMSGEPQVTSYHRQFMGTVDYIWYSEGLQIVKVLDTIPKHVLQRTPGFPTQKWGSDHLALVCQLAFLAPPRASRLCQDVNISQTPT